MSAQVGTKATMGCLVTLAVGIVAVTYFTTSSANPIRIYESEGVWTKVVITVLGLMFAMGLLNWIAKVAGLWFLGRLANRPLDDVMCPGCGLSLVPYVGSHGHPIQCTKCGILWHSGGACYSKGLDRALVLPTLPCPGCRDRLGRQESRANDMDLMGDEDAS